MENNISMNINKIPAKTWYWLNLNETGLKWSTENAACRIVSDNILRDVDMQDNISAIPCGTGNETDRIFTDSKIAVKKVSSDKTKKVRMEISADDNSAAGVLFIDAKEKEDITVIQVFKGTDVNKEAAFRTVINADSDSRVKLVQINMMDEGKTLLNDVGCVCKKNARFEILQLFTGRSSVYNGVRTELTGDGSSFDAKIGYIGQNEQLIDMNLVINHTGKNTECNITADGALKDAARKVFRGTIDFKNGASGAKGTETENVLMLGDDVSNKTIPVILCAEEDVEGNHGATIGELDDDTLLYFAARGIDKDMAEVIMTRARLEALVRYIDDEETKKAVLQHLDEVTYESRE